MLKILIFNERRTMNLNIVSSQQILFISKRYKKESHCKCHSKCQCNMQKLNWDWSINFGFWFQLLNLSALETYKVSEGREE